MGGLILTTADYISSDNSQDIIIISKTKLRLKNWGWIFKYLTWFVFAALTTLSWKKWKENICFSRMERRLQESELDLIYCGWLRTASSVWNSHNRACVVWFNSLHQCANKIFLGFLSFTMKLVLSPLIYKLHFCTTFIFFLAFVEDVGGCWW